MKHKKQTATPHGTVKKAEKLVRRALGIERRTKNARKLVQRIAKKMRRAKAPATMPEAWIGNMRLSDAGKMAWRTSKHPHCRTCICRPMKTPEQVWKEYLERQQNWEIQSDRRREAMVDVLALRNKWPGIRVL